MKTNLKLLLTSLLALGVASCDFPSNTSPSETQQPSADSTPTESVSDSTNETVNNSSTDETITDESSTEDVVAEHIDYGAQLKLDMNNPNRVRQEVTVYRYIDGDTTHFNVVDIPGAEDGVLKGRYLAIDTPESTMKVEEWGKSASIYTKSKLKDAKSIIIESDVDYWAVDSNLRHLIWVWYMPSDSDDYRLLNLDIVQDGYSMVKNAQSFEYGQIISLAYQQAIREQLHLWTKVPKSDPNYYYGDIQEVSLREVRESVIGVGSGTKNVPYSLTGAVKAMEGYTDDTYSDNPVYVGGVLTSATKVDDEHANLYYQLEEKINPLSVDDVVTLTQALDDGKYSTEIVSVYGEVAETPTYKDSYKSYTIWLKNSAGEKAFELYSVGMADGLDYSSNLEGLVGKTVVCTGYLQKYVGKNGNVTLEMPFINAQYSPTGQAYTPTISLVADQYDASLLPASDFVVENAIVSDANDLDLLIGNYVISAGYLHYVNGNPGLVSHGEEDLPYVSGTRDAEVANVSILKDTKIAINGIISFISGNTAYIQAYDEDIDAIYGLPVYMGFTTYDPIKVGNELRIVGNLEYYEAGDTYQLSNLTYMAMKPKHPDNMKVISEDNDIIVTPVTKQLIDARADYLVSTLVSASDLTVTKVYTTTKGESAGAMTLTCQDGDGNEFKVRTGVLYNENKELVTEDDFINKTINVTGIFDKYEGEYQIRLLKFADVEIK